MNDKQWKRLFVDTIVNIVNFHYENGFIRAIDSTTFIIDDKMNKHQESVIHKFRTPYGIEDTEIYEYNDVFDKKRKIFIYKKWYKNGNKKSKEYYKNGKLHRSPINGKYKAAYKTWYENGNKHEKKYCKNGELYRPSIKKPIYDIIKPVYKPAYETWHENGNKQFKQYKTDEYCHVVSFEGIFSNARILEWDINGRLIKNYTW